MSETVDFVESQANSVKEAVQVRSSSRERKQTEKDVNEKRFRAVVSA